MQLTFSKKLFLFITLRVLYWWQIRSGLQDQRRQGHLQDSDWCSAGWLVHWVHHQLSNRILGRRVWSRRLGILVCLHRQNLMPDCGWWFNSDQPQENESCNWEESVQCPSVESQPNWICNWVHWSVSSQLSCSLVKWRTLLSFVIHGHFLQ